MHNHIQRISSNMIDHLCIINTVCKGFPKQHNLETPESCSQRQCCGLDDYAGLSPMSKFALLLWVLNLLGNQTKNSKKEQLKMMMLNEPTIHFAWVYLRYLQQIIKIDKGTLGCQWLGDVGMDSHGFSPSPTNERNAGPHKTFSHESSTNLSEKVCRFTSQVE